MEAALPEGRNPSPESSRSDEEATVRTDGAEPTPGRPDGRAVWTPGSVVGGRYRVLRGLGSGGMGSVVLADDLFLRRPVAIKTLRGPASEGSEAFERMRAEVAAAHAVNHPGVARTHDLGLEAGSVYLTMEVLDGESLSARVAREGPLPLDEARGIMVDVCLAVHAAHLAGVVHRDLKPGNIQLVPGRGAVVMDFGLAAPVASDSSSAAEQAPSGSSGTPAYMAPEQWKGEPQGPAADIYAIGAILFLVLTGHRPFEPKDPGALMYVHCFAPPPAVRSRRPDVPAALDRLVHDCLAKEPTERPASALEVALRLAKPQRWQRLLTALLAALALTAVLVAGATVWRNTSALVVREMRPAAKRLAMLIAKDLAVSDLDLVRGPEDMGTEAFRRVRAQLLGARAESPEVRYVYTMRKLQAPGKWAFVVDADPVDYDEDGDGAIDAGDVGAPPGMEYDASPIPAMMSFAEDPRPTSDPGFEEGPWGLLLSGYAPLRSRRGDLYLVGVDLSNGPLLLLRNMLYAIFLVLGLLAAVLVVVLRRRRGRGAETGVAAAGLPG